MSKKTKETNAASENEELIEDSNENVSSKEDNINKDIAKLKEELDKQKDLLLRTAAEYENFRRRTEKEKAMIYSDATCVAVSAILPIADNIERAVKIESASAEDYQKGFEMIIKQFNDALSKLSVESFGEKGDAFNPEIHNAVSHIDNENFDENVISEVFQKGYKVKDRVIRHAMVQVAN